MRDCVLHLATAYRLCVLFLLKGYYILSIWMKTISYCFIFFFLRFFSLIETCADFPVDWLVCETSPIHSFAQKVPFTCPRRFLCKQIRYDVVSFFFIFLHETYWKVHRTTAGHIKRTFRSKPNHIIFSTWIIHKSPVGRHNNSNTAK